MELESDYFIGVDVGTGSVRAALVNINGEIISMAVNPIRTWNPCTDHYEQSSDDIWNACISTIKSVSNNVSPHKIKGIGFDATCSLVAIDREGKPITVSTSGNMNQNIVLWMDHRAKTEADFINKTGHQILQYVGGKVSLEMQIPKLLWLKKHMTDTWTTVKWFFDLPDFLTWKATGATSRSLCSVVCKWNYERSADGIQGWNTDFLSKVELSDLLIDNAEKIGNDILSPGQPCGLGLRQEVATELNLLPGTPVGTSIIDAHAGGLGLIGCSAKNISSSFSSRLSLICGTSTCHMAVNIAPTFVSGIWGPYFSAMVPNLWLNEAGQSASGALIDHIINTHPAFNKIKEKTENSFIQNYLKKLLEEMALKSGLKNVCFLTKDLHIWPDFHGNRSPIADPNLRGTVSGLKLSAGEEDLAVLYLATIQALSYGTRHIIESLQKNGYEKIESIVICGGLSKDPLFVQTQADAMNLPVLKPRTSESVLVGAAILGACGGNYFSDVNTAIKHMGGSGDVIYPDKDLYLYHNKKYEVFLKMVKDQYSYKNIMST